MRLQRQPGKQSTVYNIADDNAQQSPFQSPSRCHRYNSNKVWLCLICLLCVYIYTDRTLLTRNYNLHRYYLVNNLILTVSMTITEFHGKVGVCYAPCSASNPTALACNISLEENKKTPNTFWRQKNLTLNLRKICHTIPSSNSWQQGRRACALKFFTMTYVPPVSL